jgi:dihydroflavonol-4-reductase
MKVFLTGATGLLGNNIARQLTQRGDKVVALVRNTPPPEVFEGVDVELVHGTLEDQQTIQDAVDKCDGVIHSAAMIHLGWQRMEESLRANREGTAAVAEAARRRGCRMVHIGTVNTLALATGGVPSNEDTLITPATAQVPCAYVVSKRASVDVVRQAIEQGLDATFVHPGFMLGPWDWKPSSGRMLLELGRRYVPACPTGGCSVCDVRDVAAGVLAALERGQTGRHYIMAGENWRYRKLWSEMARRMGRSAPIFPCGPLVRAGVAAYAAIKLRLTNIETDVNSASLKVSSQLHWYDGSRAREELGYTNRDVHETLDDAAAWILARFLAQPV